jgi:Protein of unknown function (DUF3800)
MCKIQMDFTENRQHLINLYSEYGSFNCDATYQFFYDETNNHRTVYLKDGRLNIDKDDNFTLGGVLFPNENLPELSIDELKSILNLQPTVKEVKFNHIAHGNFLTCLKSQKLKMFLRLLLDKGFFLHYTTINTFYFSIVDILDSLFFEFDKSQDIFNMYYEIKAIFYELLKNNINNTYSILEKYNYPDIKSSEINNFIIEIKTLLLNNIDSVSLNPFLCSILIQMFEGDKSKLIFAQDFKGKELIDNFFINFCTPVYTFKNSEHIFDEEEMIIPYFEKTDIIIDGISLENYIFKNSKDSIYIQLSDVVIGVLGKCFSFLVNQNIIELDNIVASLNPIQKENYFLLRELIQKSLDFNHALFQNIDSCSNKFKFDKFFALDLPQG